MAIEEIQAIEEMNENNGQSQIGDDFYETIEAPKFVDLNAPDHRAIGDDRYWFCERVGCDQKHEEEMDSELIYKDFVLRVMASRSPSVRFRRTLCKKDSRTLPKCPNTVPPKPLRSRISKLAMISSIPQKTTTDKTREKTGQIMSARKHEAKRKGQESSIEAKAFTTPGKQNKHVPNPGSFRSVRNVRTEELRVSKNRIVAKALVFHSPKKTVKLKRSVELRSSKKKICNGMRKQEKRSILGFNHKLVPLDQSRKPLRGQEAKSRAFDSSHSQKQNGVKVKNPDTLKERVMENEEELSQNKNGESRALEKYEDSNNKSGENDQSLRPEPIVHETEDPPEVQESDLGNAKHHEAEGKKIALAFKCSVKEDVMDPEVSNGAKEEEAIESDDKENASASDINRKADHVADPLIKRKDFGKKGTCKTPQKVATTRNKCSNGKPSSAGSHAQGVVKYTKPKPTNPKPFRLRTDERHILKEANTERKQHQPSAKEEMMSFLGSNVGNLRQKHEIHQEKRNPRAKVCKGPYKLYPRLDDTQDQEEISEMAEPVIRKQTAMSQGPTSSGRKKRTPMKTPTKGLPEAAKEIITEESKEVATVKPSVCVASGDKRHATTVPRGPNFHSIHIPKNCTKRLALEA